jgi:hypothetical protein
VNPATTCAAPLFAGVLALAVASANAQEATRPGLWQFTAQGQMASSPAGFSSPPGAETVPTDPSLSCSVESTNRSGATVRWTMTCSVPQGAFRSDAVAQYRGGTMDGTMTTYVPMIGGQMTQRLTGRYLGPCTK